jgi:DNA-binding protein H-NS
MTDTIVDSTADVTAEVTTDVTPAVVAPATEVASEVTPDGTMTPKDLEAIALMWKKIYSMCKKFNVTVEVMLENKPAAKAKKEKAPKAAKVPKAKKEKAPKVEGEKKPHSLKGTTVEAKYMINGKPWSGRGLMPKSMSAAIAADPTLTKASFLIKK